jgi:hypothetical protein
MEILAKIAQGLMRRFINLPAMLFLLSSCLTGMVLPAFKYFRVFCYQIIGIIPDIIRFKIDVKPLQ